MPIVVSEELLARAVEMVCYFLTALGGVVSLMFMPRG
jgi:hypothetical protein